MDPSLSVRDIDASTGILDPASVDPDRGNGESGKDIRLLGPITSAGVPRSTIFMDSSSGVSNSISLDLGLVLMDPG